MSEIDAFLDERSPTLAVFGRPRSGRIWSGLSRRRNMYTSARGWPAGRGAQYRVSTCSNDTDDGVDDSGSAVPGVLQSSSVGTYPGTLGR